jgi:hypothetical protein
MVFLIHVKEKESQCGLLLFYSSTLVLTCDPSFFASSDIKMEEAKHHSYACYHYGALNFVSKKRETQFLAFGRMSIFSFYHKIYDMDTRLFLIPIKFYFITCNL